MGIGQMRISVGWMLRYSGEHLRCAFADNLALPCNMTEVDLSKSMIAIACSDTCPYLAIVAIADATDEEFELLFVRSSRHLEDVL